MIGQRWPAGAPTAAEQGWELILEADFSDPTSLDDCAGDLEAFSVDNGYLEMPESNTNGVWIRKKPLKPAYSMFHLVNCRVSSTNFNQLSIGRWLEGVAADAIGYGGTTGNQTYQVARITGATRSTSSHNSLPTNKTGDAYLTVTMWGPSQACYVSSANPFETGVETSCGGALRPLGSGVTDYGPSWPALFMRRNTGTIHVYSWKVWSLD